MYYAEDPGLDSSFADFLYGVNTIFYGRISYELRGQSRPDNDADSILNSIFDSIHSKTKFVFSITRHQDDGTSIFINSDIIERVQQIRHQPRKDIWLYGGATLITTFVNLDLVGIYRLGGHPVILGSGKPLFKDIEGRINFEIDRSERITKRSDIIKL